MTIRCVIMSMCRLHEKEKVYMIDCGCGFKSGRLGCLCLETKEEFYV